VWPAALVASRGDLGVAAVVISWVAVVLPLDDAGTGRQLLLGGVSWLVLVALLARETVATRAQVAVVVVFATAVEYTFSAGLGVYVYRLHQVPAYVPPGHGLVYLAALALGRSALFAAGRRGLIALTCVVAGGYAAWGLVLSSHHDLLGFLWFCCLLLWMRRGRAPLVFVGAFLIVTYLELLGTGLGTWTWSLHDPTGLVSIGNPPSGAAGGYGFFDAAALVFAPRIVTAMSAGLRRLRGADFSAGTQERERFGVQLPVGCEGTATVGAASAGQVGEGAARFLDD
jgi:hypothetical protein